MTDSAPGPPISWTFGDVSLTRVVESEEPLLSAFEIYPDCTQADIDANLSWIAPRFYDPAVALLVVTIQSFLVRAADRVILIDTCAGNYKHRERPFFHLRRWPWLDRLHAAGVTPQDVDLVMCTHLHVDHVGWNTRLEDGRWVPTFPNARYVFSRRELDFWMRESATDGISRTGDYVADSVLPVLATDQAQLVDGDFALADQVWAEAAPGHTPGHYVVHLGAAGTQAVLSGDLFHHPLQLLYPHWSTRFCADPDLSRVTRLRLLSAWAGSETMVFPAHFPTPVGGYLEREGKRFRYRYDQESIKFP